MGMPPEVPCPRPTSGSSPWIFEYDPNVMLPPVCGWLPAVVDTPAGPEVLDDPSSESLSPHDAATSAIARPAIMSPRRRMRSPIEYALDAFADARSSFT